MNPGEGNQPHEPAGRSTSDHEEEVRLTPGRPNLQQQHDEGLPNLDDGTHDVSASDRPLPPDYQPSEYTIIIGRGMTNSEHSGNKWLKSLAADMVHRYTGENQRRKTEILDEISRIVRTKTPVGAFVKRDTANRWVEVNEKVARDKIGYYLRDQHPDQYRSTSQSKTEKRKRSKRDKKNKSHILDDDDSPPTREGKKMIPSRSSALKIDGPAYSNPKREIQILADPSFTRTSEEVVVSSDMSQYTDMIRHHQQLQQHGIQVLTTFVPQFESSAQHVPLQPASFPFPMSIQEHGSLQQHLLQRRLTDGVQQLRENRLRSLFEEYGQQGLFQESSQGLPTSQNGPLDAATFSPLSVFTPSYPQGSLSPRPIDPSRELRRLTVPFNTSDQGQIPFLGGVGVGYPTHQGEPQQPHVEGENTLGQPFGGSSLSHLFELQQQQQMKRRRQQNQKNESSIRDLEQVATDSMVRSSIVGPTDNVTENTYSRVNTLSWSSPFRTSSEESDKKGNENC